VLGQPVDNEDEFSDDESQDEQLEEENPEEFRYDWMHLAEMGSNVRIISNSDLGSRDLDRNHNWINEAQQNYSSEDLETAHKFVQQASRDSRNNDTEDENETSDIMYQNLNEKQKIIFNRIVTHYNDTILGHQVEALRILIMGTAGTRKSYLIKAIRGRLRTMAENGTKSSVIVIAPTGVAAFNITEQRSTLLFSYR
jgi:hypothetical protein